MSQFTRVALKKAKAMGQITNRAKDKDFALLLPPEGNRRGITEPSTVQYKLEYRLADYLLSAEGIKSCH